MKEFFKETRFKPASLDLVTQCGEVIEEYQAQGLRLTLRQLYYQLVTKNIIRNEERSYKNLSSLVSDARLAGLLDWDAIEDRIRIPSRPSEWDNISDLVESALASYRLPRWRDQLEYVELWTEKDALAGVLRPLARKAHVTMMVNRGYTSQSAMYDASKRFLDQYEDGKVLYLLYLGDFDPSGEDMVRDLRDRFEMFNVRIQVDKIALTLDQVKQYNPPPNPAKRSDPRSRDFITRYGASSWEVDAINPSELQRIVGVALASHIDEKRMQRVISQESLDKEGLRQAAKALVN